MRMWIIILGLTLICAFFGILFLIAEVRKFSFAIKLTETKGKKFATLICALITIAVYAALYFIFGEMNAIIIYIVLAILWLICEGVFLLAQKITKKKPKRYYVGVVALLLATVYFSVGYYHAHHIVETDYNIRANDIGVNGSDTAGKREPLKIVQFADAHVGTTMNGDEFAEYMRRIDSLNPDMVLITGDLIDNASYRPDLEKACRALGEIHSKYGVYYVYGNHDKGYAGSEQRGYTPEEFKEMLTDNKVTVLEDEVVNIGDDYVLIGRMDKSEGGRKDISELMQETDTGRYSIVMDHQPSDYDCEAEAGCNLVLSGHTHGGQLIPITYVGEWIGANDATYGYERRKNTDFIVTSGLGDWEISFKTGCVSEYVVLSL